MLVRYYKRSTTNNEREYNQLQHNKSRYLKLVKKLTKQVIKQKNELEKTGEDTLADLRLDMQKMKAEIIANFNEKLSEKRTQVIKRTTMDTK